MGLSLLDIHRQSKVVAGVDVYGVSVDAIASMLPRFPELQLLMKGEMLTPDQIMKVAPSAVSAIIAAGCGFAGVEKAEDVARGLGVETQLDFLVAIGELTFTNGFGPFVKRLERLSEAVSANFGKGTVTNLRRQSKALSQADSPQDLSGT